MLAAPAIIPSGRCIRSSREKGGVTILVALMLLVLLTISAMAMAKNSLREVIISGTTRQGADVRNIADTGLDWSMCWITDSSRAAPASGSDAEALRTLVNDLAGDATRQGIAQPFTRPIGGEMTISQTGTVTRSFDLAVTTMGEVELQGTQRNPQDFIGKFNPATLQLWSVRSNALANYGGGMEFMHSRESWFTLPPKQQQ